MSSALESLGLDRLPLEERIVLAHDLWESIELEVERSPLTDEQRRMLDQRLDELDAHPENVLTWEEIKSRILSRK